MQIASGLCVENHVELIAQGLGRTLRDILTEAGLDLRLGPCDMEELQQDVDVAMELGEELDDNNEEIVRRCKNGDKLVELDELPDPESQESDIDLPDDPDTIEDLLFDV